MKPDQFSANVANIGRRSLERIELRWNGWAGNRWTVLVGSVAGERTVNGPLSDQSDPFLGLSQLHRKRATLESISTWGAPYGAVQISMGGFGTAHTEWRGKALRISAR